MKHKDIKKAGIKLYTDEHVPIDHARYGPDVRKRIRRFTALQRATLSWGSADPGVLAGRLIALDLISVSDFPLALNAQPYRYRDEHCIEWGEDENHDRRTLCVLTVVSMTKGRDYAAEADALSALARSITGYSALEPEVCLWPTEPQLTVRLPVASDLEHCQGGALVGTKAVPCIESKAALGAWAHDGHELGPGGSRWAQSACGPNGQWFH